MQRTIIHSPSISTTQVLYFHRDHYTLAAKIVIVILMQSSIWFQHENLCEKIYVMVKCALFKCVIVSFRKM